MLEKPENYCDSGDITSSYLPGERDKHQDRGDDSQRSKFGIPRLHSAAEGDASAVGKRENCLELPSARIN